ncbi:hypothetical protein CEE44_01605 [Candidatus Woesearchaeota archaeon B3_Woes]|nr:MAG: hypothetical protein CEE44_01605 [Candidatus Woesearchaeota archaeon B3_Woes]
MEKFQELRENSKKKILLADHILTQTYPLLKDPKLLLSVVENLFLAYTNSIGALLHYDRLFKRIPQFQDNFDSKFKMFKEKCAVRHNIKQEDINTIKEIKQIIVQHRKSPMEFAREDRLVICSDKYSMKTIKVDGLKKMMINAKEFVDKINNITSKNEEIFR